MRLPNPAFPDPHGHLAREIARVLREREAVVARQLMRGMVGYCEYQARRTLPPVHHARN